MTTINSDSRATPARLGRADPTDDIADVVVVGGGIVGAAAALGAAQAGLATVWVVGDGGPPPTAASRDARVYALSPGTQAFLERLRVWDPLMAVAGASAPVLDMRVYGDAAAHGALHFGAYEAATERLATIVEHRALARVLETAAAYFPGIERVDGAAIGVRVHDDHVAVETGRGTKRARLVVAADGAASPTRAALEIGVDATPYRQRALVGNFGCAKPHGGTAFQWFTDDGVVALLPLAPGADGQAMSLVWSAPDAVAEALLAAGPAAVAARLSALVAAEAASAIGPLTALDDLVAIPLVLQSARRTIGPRAVLVGDAAHVVHPLAGQGLNLGLADVAVLLDCLSARESFRDCGDRVVLRRHERARAGPVLAMRQMTNGLVRLFGLREPGVAQLRSFGMRTLDRAAPLKRVLMRQAAGLA